MHKVNGRCAKEATELPARLVLCDLEHVGQVALAVVGKPNLNPIGEDRDDHHQEDLAPMEQRKATNRVPQNPKCADGALSTGGEGLHMKPPRQAGGEEDTQVAEGGGGCDMDRVSHPIPKCYSTRLYSQMFLGRFGWMEEHGLCLLSIDGESQPAQPLEDLIHTPRRMRGHGVEGGTGSEHRPIVDIEGEVGMVPVCSGMEEGGGKEGGDDGGCGRALGHAPPRFEPFRGRPINVEGHLAVLHLICRATVYTIGL
jgi:hypothetical protein